jgi:hypothetical protein
MRTIKLAIKLAIKLTIKLFTPHDSILHENYTKKPSVIKEVNRRPEFLLRWNKSIGVWVSMRDG